VPAATLDDDDLAGLLTAVYAGYWHPIEVDADALRRMIATYDLDRDASVVALDGAAPIGLALLALRDDQAWVGGMGVLPERRGAGLGERLTRRLVESARARGVARVRLEVLEQNAPAIAIYRRVGFAHARDVAVWKLDAAPAGGDTSEADVTEALGRLQVALGDLPWQRDAGTVASMRALGSTLVAVGTGAACAVYTATGEQASILQLAADTHEEAAALLRAPFARGATSLSWLNGPVDGPAPDVLRDAGAVSLARQHELTLVLQA
jgi:GNAT superfamily N-acetyltransferase